MKKVISITLFGEGHAKYSQYLRAFVLAHHNVYPKKEGWSLCLHIDDVIVNSELKPFLLGLHKGGLLDLRYMGPARHADEFAVIRGMLWRMTPVFESDIDYVFPRDVDACPMPRERLCCEAFIASPANIHTIHDNVMHVGMMGGLCGFKTKEFREISKIETLEELYRYGQTVGADDWGRHGADQDILNRMIDRVRSLTLLEHRFNGWHAGSGAHPSRAPGVYRCHGLSTPVPNVRQAGDHLANHMGAAGFDHEAACLFWEKHGDPAVTDAVREAERATQ